MREVENVIIEANAKINLSIDVINRLPSGYHEVEMVMQSLDLHDTLSITKTDKESKIFLENSLNFNLPTDESNLALKAFRLLQKEYSITSEIIIRITKNIPAAGGMAGGSADAAAVFVGCNQLFKLGLSSLELEKLGASLGADIPFCIRGGTVLATDIGTKLTTLNPLPKIYGIAINDNIEMPTKTVFQNLQIAKIKNRPATNDLVEAINNGNADIFPYMANVLEESSFVLEPRLEDIKKEIATTGLFAMMSGSGGTMLGLAINEIEVDKAYEILKEKYAFVVKFTTK